MTIEINALTRTADRLQKWLDRKASVFIVAALLAISVVAFYIYLDNGLGLAYNDARSHLDIGRRVVEGLNPGLAQLGSVWLPLTHLLMAATIWSDFMWHSGLSGAMLSMIAFIGTGILVYRILAELGAGLSGRYAGVAIFVANLNILYLQSTAMTELMLIVTMTAGAYYLLLWFKRGSLYHLVISGFFIMLSTLVRYDGWFLLFFAFCAVFLWLLWKKGYAEAEGAAVVFGTLAGVGVVLWLMWNLVIFGDPLYFAFGPYSAHAQQDQLEMAGVLPTKGDWLLSAKIYFYALAYNTNAFVMVMGFFGAVFLWCDKRLPAAVRVASTVFMAPLIFNILALYLGHSVLYIQGLSGNTWFNVRYGIMMLPSFAVFTGYLIHRAVPAMRVTLIGLLAFVIFFSFANRDAVVIDDAQVGSSQKNVTEVSGWLKEHAAQIPGFILISAASHDSIIFTSGLPMQKFIHEGAGVYYDAAIENPDRWARWIVVRSYSNDDSTWRLLKDNAAFIERYRLVDHYPFADIYMLSDEYSNDLITEPILEQKN